jgi:hypothetical protein
MSMTQKAEADLLRCQMKTLATAADIEISAAKTAKKEAEGKLESAMRDFRHLIYFASAGWVLFTILAVTSALHYGTAHTSTPPPAGAAASSVAPFFHQR